MDDYTPKGMHFDTEKDPTCLVEELLAEEENTSTSQHFALPPPEIVQLLVRAYFTYINDHMPVLHRPSFVRLLQSGEADVSSDFRSLRTLSRSRGGDFCLFLAHQSLSSWLSALAS